MIDYLRKYERTSIIVSIISIAASLLLIINPAEVMNIFVGLVGATMILGGVWSAICYFKDSSELKYFRMELFIGIVLILGGILIIKNAAVLISILSMAVAVWIILRGVLDLQVSFNLKRADAKGWWIALVAAFLTIILGIVIFINPFSTAEITVVATGIMMLVSSIFDLGESIGILIALRSEK